MRYLLTAVALLFSIQCRVELHASIETFETETNGASTFTEGGRTFTTSGDLIVEVVTGLGSGGSDGWLGTLYVGNTPLSGSSATPSSGNVGSIMIDSGWSFIVNSFDAWTGASDGEYEQHGQVKFIGTLIDNTMSEVTLDIDQNTLFDFQTGLSFGGTSLDGVSLKKLEFELLGTLGGQTNPLSNGALDYFALDNLDFTAAQIQTPPPPPPGDLVPEPSAYITWGLLGLCIGGGCLWRRCAK